MPDSEGQSENEQLQGRRERVQIVLTSRRPLRLLLGVALFICTIAVCDVPSMRAGFQLASVGSSDLPFDVQSFIWADLLNDGPESPDAIWMTSNRGAAAWSDDEGGSQAADAPFGPKQFPFGQPIATSVLAGFAATLAGRNLTAPQVHSGDGGLSFAGISGTKVGLPIPLLRFRQWWQMFVYIPDAPPIEVFHPS